MTVDENPDHVKIIDFGVARDLEVEIGPTQQGFLVGTPEYMAPELLHKGVKANPRTDLYAVGVTLYKLLTGVVPYRGSLPLAVTPRARRMPGRHRGHAKRTLQALVDEAGPRGVTSLAEPWLTWGASAHCRGR